MSTQQIDDAFNSMLRTDYIPLRDTNKLNLLAQYFVDYYGFLSQILSENDQLIVGRRGTGKTTLLYRALVECMRSWGPAEHCAAKPRTLAIYLDLGKCQALADVNDGDFDNFEHIFASELCDAMTDEIGRSWPAVNSQPGFFSKLFRSAEEKQAAETKRLLGLLAEVLKSGVPRIIDQSGAVETRDLSKVKKQAELSGSGKLSDSPALNIGGKKSTRRQWNRRKNPAIESLTD